MSWRRDLRIARVFVEDRIGALGDEQLDSLSIGLSQAGDADVGACCADLQCGKAQRSLDRTAVNVDMLDAAEWKRLDSVGNHAAAQRQVVFPELIGKSPHFEYSDGGHQRKQQENDAADQQWRNLLIGLSRNDHGADGDDGGCQCYASQADPQVAGIDGHECFVVEPREVIGWYRFVAERIGHACFLATPWRIRSWLGTPRWVLLASPLKNVHDGRFALSLFRRTGRVALREF